AGFGEHEAPEFEIRAQHLAHALRISVPRANPSLEKPGMPRINGPRDAGVGAANVAGVDVAPTTVPEQRCIAREHPLLLGEPGSDLVTRRVQGNEAVLLFPSARARSKNAGELRV